jgi:hypothetical protein
MKPLKLIRNIYFEEDDYRSITYEYDEHTKIIIASANGQFGKFENITILNDAIKIIPYHIIANFKPHDEKRIELTVRFDTPIFLDEKQYVDKIFDYYQTLEDFLNEHYEELRQID